MNWKKLSAFAPMLAVIVLAGCMGKTLAGYTPATYEAKAEEITLQEETTQSTEEKGQQTSKIKKKTKKAAKTESKKKAAKETLIWKMELISGKVRDLAERLKFRS